MSKVKIEEIIGNEKKDLEERVVVAKSEKDFFNYVDDIYEYNLQTKKWNHIGKYLNENKGFPQIINLDDKSLGILGGHTYIKDASGRTIDHPVSSFYVLLMKP